MFQIPRKVLGRFSKAELAEIEQTEVYVNQVHAGQVRAEGVPYVTHLIAAAEYAVVWNCDATTVVATLLHDVVEDTAVTLREVERDFGGEVAFLVDGATKVEGHDKLVADELTRKKIFDYAKQDRRVAYVKLADRVHNLSTISFLSEERRQRIVQESETFYVVLAETYATPEVLNTLMGQLRAVRAQA